MTDTIQDSVIEAMARALCVRQGNDPDRLEPGNTPYYDDREVVDGELYGEPAFLTWRQYVSDVEATLRAAEAHGFKLIGREPTEAMLKVAKWNSVGAGGWEASWDAAPSAGGSHEP